MKNKSLMKAMMMLLSFAFLPVLAAQTLCGGATPGCGNEKNTALSFLNMSPDAEATSMGHSGIAKLPSITSLSLNSSNLAFMEYKFGLRQTYAPWLRRLGLVDSYFAHLAGYGKIGEKDVLGASFRVFSWGSVQFIDENGGALASDRPREIEALLSYNRKLNENISVGVSLKYLMSRMAIGQDVDGGEIRPIKTVAGDISFTYRKPVKMGSLKGMFISGLAIRNIGPKVSHFSENKYKLYMPTNLGLGSGFVLEFSENHTLTFTFDINRLLVPSSSLTENSGDPDVLDFREKSAFKGAISSLGDAQGGITNEFKENQYSFGLEYRYKFIHGRHCHFNEHKSEGNRKLLTSGLGFSIGGFGIDFASIYSITDRYYPEKFRLSFTYNFDEFWKEDSEIH